MENDPPKLPVDVRQALLHRMKLASEQPMPSAPPISSVNHFEDSDAWKQMQIVRSASEMLGIKNPFFRAHEQSIGAQCVIEGRTYVNFSSYDYLGLNGHPYINRAVSEAISQYGTSCSASRLVAGERPIHRALESSLSALHSTEDCVAFVSGHATNVSVISALFDRSDLIVADALSHNSIQQGVRLSGARRFGFAHNDVQSARTILAVNRERCRRALIVIEGHYSMDGDIPDLPAFISLAREFNALLMVDEAHSVGVLGETGSGLREHFGVAGSAVDIWMGTLSKSLASCGGYVATSHNIAELLRYTAAGFIYSVGLSPALSASALAALCLMQEEPQRIATLRLNAERFLITAKAAGFDTGLSSGRAIVSVIVGSSILAAKLSASLFDRGINVQPILYPAVSERSARLRFFLTSNHTFEQIDRAVTIMAEERERLTSMPTNLAELAAQLSKMGG